MALDRLTKITGPGVSTDTNWVGNNANFTGITTAGSSFNIGVTTIHSTLAEVHNIKSTGIITATGGSFSGNVTAVDGTFTGNVSIAGTLTYEDVTNIDSVGIITAPAVDVDDFLDVGSNIKLGNAGVITATTFKGDGDFVELDVDGHTNLDNVSISGVTTHQGNIKLPDDAEIILGNADDFKIQHSSGNVNFILSNTNRQLQYKSDGGFLIRGGGNQMIANFLQSAVTLYQGQQIKLTTVDKGITVGTGVTIETNGQSNFSGISTFHGGIYIKEANNYSTVQTHGHPNLDMPFVLSVNGGGSTGIGTALFTGGYGTRPEVVFEQRHGGNFVNSYPHSYPWKIKWTLPNDNDTTDDQVLIQNSIGIGGNFSSFQVKTTDNSTGLRNTLDLSSTSSTLWVDNNVAFRVNSDGVNIPTWLLHHGDSDTKIGFPANDTIRFETAGSQRININSSGKVSITNDLDVDGHTNLDNVSIAGVTTAAGNINMGGGNLIFGDSGGDSEDKLVFGAGSDLKIFHNGSNNYIDVAGDGHLYIRPKANFYIQDYTNGEVWIDGTLNGGVKLYNNGIQRFETYSSGATVNGPTLNISPSSGNANLVLKSGSGSVYTNIHFKANDNTLTSYITSWSGGTLFLNGTSLIRSSIAGTEITEVASTGFHPVTDSARDLGLNAKRWRNVYADTLYGDGSNLTGISAGTSLSGSTNNTVCTVTGANAIQGESTLTYDGTTFKNLIDVPGTTPTIAEFRSSTSLYGGGFRFRTNNSWGLLQFTNNNNTSFASFYNSTGGWHWDSNLQFHGAVTPWTDGNLNLGASNKRWANVYTTDLQLSNEGKTNDVDGTWGDWTLQEGENDIFMINNRTGKKFAITMREVS